MILAPGCASTSTKALFRTQLLERGSVEATGDALVQAQDAFTAGQFQEAERQYEIYVAQEPTDIARWQRLADFYRRIGMRDRMRLAIEVALDLLSDDQVADPALQQWKQCVQAALNGDAEVGDC